MIGPVFYNIIALGLAAIIACVLGSFLLRKLRKDKESFAFGTYIFLAGVVFFTQAAGLLFWQLGYPQLDKVAFVGSILNPAVLLIIYYHLLLKITHKDKAAKIGSFILFLIVLPGSVGILMGGFAGPFASDWGPRYIYTGLTQLILLGIIIKAVLSLIDIIARGIKWVREKKITDFYNSFISFTLIMIAVHLLVQFSGWVDVGWNLLLVRIISLTSILISYLVYTGEEVRRKFQIE